MEEHGLVPLVDGVFQHNTPHARLMGCYGNFAHRWPSTVTLYLSFDDFVPVFRLLFAANCFNYFTKLSAWNNE